MQQNVSLYEDDSICCVVCVCMHICLFVCVFAFAMSFSSPTLCVFRDPRCAHSAEELTLVCTVLSVSESFSPVQLFIHIQRFVANEIVIKRKVREKAWQCHRMWFFYETTWENSQQFLEYKVYRLNCMDWLSSSESDNCCWTDNVQLELKKK